MGFWRDKTDQQKADTFDNQYEASRREAKRKEEAGEYPYDLAKKAEPKTVYPERRGKGKHAK
jgi:hypothetical protein